MPDAVPLEPGLHELLHARTDGSSNRLRGGGACYRIRWLSLGCDGRYGSRSWGRLLARRSVRQLCSSRLRRHENPRKLSGSLRVPRVFTTFMTAARTTMGLLRAYRAMSWPRSSKTAREICGSPPTVAPISFETYPSSVSLRAQAYMTHLAS